ncbi:apolipoprotein N-acyltransferase [Stieleria sp. JC731]|uniref:apolipoprotein N-acyltransferase n=1 Tax=Pirellulaceae TaxID=2691357 RepID=UPI001E3D3AE4|nr:apolipoprotein N-acyltransferase [Stieleria sp. JC731]MCC9599255.1 apolipoprotein N-acyltransferase [Stieleria sp. JC731]
METNENDVDTSTPKSSPIGRNRWLLIWAAVVLRWLAQPPLNLWPCIFIAVVPLLMLGKPGQLTRRHFGGLFLAATVYWAVSLQGLRHANPLIYPCWIALAGYLACYTVLFVFIVNRLSQRKSQPSIAKMDPARLPLFLLVPTVWVGLECIRNYFMTGISVLMLGHSLADVPHLIQIADIAGTYAVSFVIVTVNVAIFLWCEYLNRSGDKSKQQNSAQQKLAQPSSFSQAAIGGVFAIVLLVSSFLYGAYRLGYQTQASSVTIALIGRNEPIEYVQTKERELEIFHAYLEESTKAIKQNEPKVDALVWPESMMTGSMPWLDGDGSAEDARRNGVTLFEVQAWLEEQRNRFQFRAANMLQLLAQDNGDRHEPPHLIGGCAVIDYGETTKGYSGLVHLTPDADVDQWYGKMHLVMFGEYIPLIKSIPWVRDFVPPGMGIDSGDGPRVFQVGDFGLDANICIETAVERVSINHFRRLRQQQKKLPDAIVTVTNDGWFDDSSVIEHHKRCAQLLAVACRRPILSAANNGPTVWIDSFGHVVRQLPQGTNGHVLAEPAIDKRVSLIVRLGDWPARFLALLTVAIVFPWRRQHHAN